MSKKKMPNAAAPAQVRSQLRRGIPHVCYELAAFLAGALEMLKPHECPLNVLVQDATLIHLRALAEFFEPGPPVPPAAIDPKKPDLRARFYCLLHPSWKGAFFDRKSSHLMAALDKCLAHLTLGRDLSDATLGVAVAWDGPTHLHGTVVLILDTWAAFQRCVDPDYQSDLRRALRKAGQDWRVSMAGFEHRFTAEVARRVPPYTLNTVP